jgi:hypothetical protein
MPGTRDRRRVNVSSRTDLETMRSAVIGGPWRGVGVGGDASWRRHI